MFDLGWTELMVIGIVALIVVGPKDLPKMFRSLGQFTAKARSMAREFQRAMDDAADSTGVKDVARDLRRATDPQSMGLDEVNKMRNWDPLKDPGKKGKGAKPD
ncbi:Sec-independent protein translocase protein TatB, partial [Roseinatronobacter monicus]|uniref:Sec-independent protein translocase protein TatB n=1 Tax=Roseinatronobacter monicus TaxID=393481 RepID=UPI003F2B2C52